MSRTPLLEMTSAPWELAPELALVAICLAVIWAAVTFSIWQAREAAIVPFFAPHPGRLQSYFDLEPLQALESFHSFEKKFLPGEQVSCSPLLGACIGFLLLCHSSRQRIVADLERIRTWQAAGGLTAVVKAEQSEIAIVERPAST